MKGNTSDFRLEHFNVLFSDVTQAAPTLWELESTAMAIQHNQTKDKIGQVETLQITMVMFYSQNNNFTVEVTLYLLQVRLSYRKSIEGGAYHLTTSETITRVLRMAISMQSGHS